MWIAALVILGVHFFYYPKWKQKGTEATLSWDVSGYYYYLPALFIYGDLRRLEWKEDIQQRYQPASSMYQAFLHDSGHYIMKYSAGMAVQYLPFFAIGHFIAVLGPWEADGFSFPYQLLISLGSLLVSLLGLYYLRKVLLNLFDDWIAAWTLLLIVIGSNYLNYSSIDGAMTHNFLFTLYAMLLWRTMRFYEKPSLTGAIGIGFIIGLCALTRPTEIVLALVPLGWGVASQQDVLRRWKFILKERYKYGAAILMMGLIGSLQLIYWKLASGDWIVYSYQDQGFSWLSPHLKDGLFSYKKGWLVYTPLMLCALWGLVELFKRRTELFWSIGITCFLIIYITFAWDIWWYGGSLGQRAMVQSYALFAIPLAATIERIPKIKIIGRTMVILFIAICCYYNLWLTHQAHKGGLLDPENMTKAYFWEVLGKYNQPIEVKKLLDNNESFKGVRKDVKTLLRNDFEAELEHTCVENPIEGRQSLCIDGDNPYSPLFQVNLRNGDAEWIRAYATIKAPFKEWDVWKMTQMMIRFYNEDQQVKQKLIRLHRLIHDGQVKEVYIDAKCPRNTFNRVEVLFWNGGSPKQFYIDNLVIEQFNS